jgi:ubiquinol-cytochrome c reductase cytochrome b subunit
MSRVLDFFDERTGLPSAAGDWLRRPVAGGPAWRLVWPSTLVFTLLTQAVTGTVLWMYYSPSPQTAWESVYYLQRHVQGGWWLRAIHHYSAQVALVLVGIYLVQMIVRGTYRAPREFLYWAVLLMGLVTLGLNLTGDLLPWDQNSYWATHVRTGFLDLLPGIGGTLWKLAAGGTEFGQLTLTRFLTLHVGVLTPVLLILLAVHAWVARRHGLENAAADRPGEPYWPGQAVRDMAACALVLGAVLILATCCGLDFGAPANPAQDPGTARPEWSFRGLFQFRELFPSSLEILPIFVLSGLTVLVFFLMPLWGKRPGGRWFNAAFTAVVLGGLATLSWQSYRRDAQDEQYQQKRTAGRELAERVQELAEAGGGIPPAGALALVADDPKTQGPRLFEQYCASCHGAGSREQGAEAASSLVGGQETTAPDLAGFASREWLAGILDPQQVAGPKYFGNTKFKKGPMVQFVQEDAPSVDKAELESLRYAISAEADLPGQRTDDGVAPAARKIAAGRALLAARKAPCTDCHTFHGKGTAQGPDLTGYGSRQWLVEFIGNPAHKRFYGKLNDRMAVYAGNPSDPGSRILSDREIGLLADWLRGDWYEPEATTGERR